MSKKVVEKQIEVSQLAKELGRTSREILVYLKDQGEDVTLRSYRKKLTPKWQDQIREHFSDGEKTPDKSNKKKKAVSKKSLSGAQKNEKKPNTKLDLEEKRTIEISKEKEDKISTKIDAQEEKKKSTSSKEPEKPKKYAPITIISPIGHKLKPKVKSPVSIPGNVNMKSSSSGSEKVSTLSQSRETKSHKGDVPFSKETSNLEGDAPLVQKEDRRLSGPRKKDRRFEKHYREERHEKHYKDFKKRPLPPQKPQLPQSVEIEVPTTVKELSNVTGIKANELISVFMKNGILRRINDPITEEDLLFIEEEFKIEIKVKEQETAEDKLEKLLMEDPPETQKLKPPVVTFVGHVDHGKTSLLDYIRKTKVQAGEVGGITQHIGAYTVKRKGKKITFIDTPGHEAFTEMRARGVNVTDIVVLVVAADDGVMPQTKEAISHAKAAKVPIIVAINKIDKPEADPERVRRELAEQELLWDQWGGDTIMVEVSAVTGQGVEDLMESLLDLADLYEFKANPDRPGVGTIIEAKLSEHRGPIATVILQRGNLKVGDIVLCGVTFGRIRAMYNDQGV
ncbi:MAG: translation initiation factor IF-2, partial [Planctomycetota bacterium]